jgi:hypothetical protein
MLTKRNTCGRKYYERNIAGGNFVPPVGLLEESVNLLLKLVGLLLEAVELIHVQLFHSNKILAKFLVQVVIVVLALHQTGHSSVMGRSQSFKLEPWP